MNAVATTETQPKSVLLAVADRYGMSGPAFEATLRGTVFPNNGTREEFAAFLLVAREYRLNPITRQIYAFPKKGGGIIPVVSIDGWLYLVNENPAFDGMEFDHQHDDKGDLISITCRIYRKDRKMPIVVTEFLSECYRATDPWKMKNRMLRHKAMIQCARYAFGFSGIYDEDEAERFADEKKLEQRRAQISAPPPPPEERPALQAAPANTGPAAPPAEEVEEAEIVEAPAGHNLPQEEHELLTEAGAFPPMAQEEPFDAEAWLDEARERFQEAKTEADVSDVHEMFGDTANDLGMVERQKYEDMLQAAEARVRTQGQPEQAEVTGEPGPAPEEDEDDTIQAGPVAPPPPAETEGTRYLARIRSALADPIQTFESMAGLWNATKDERARLIEAGEITKAQSKELQAAIKARGEQSQAAAPASSGPSALPVEDEISAYDREFRARVEACQTIEEIGNLSANTLSERNRFAGNPLQKEWQKLVADRRKALAGIA